MNFYIWERKNQTEHRGEYSEAELKSFLEKLPLPVQERNTFYRLVMSSNKIETLFVNSIHTVTVVELVDFTSPDEFMTMIWDIFSYNMWSDQMIRNIIDESVAFDDPAKAFNFLDHMLPDEIPREIIKRLPFFPK